jgi:hypothetical protein
VAFLGGPEVVADVDTPDMIGLARLRTRFGFAVRCSAVVICAHSARRGVAGPG